MIKYKNYELDFYFQKYWKNSYKTLYITPSLEIHWDTQSKDDLDRYNGLGENKPMKGWRELLLTLDWLFFGIGITLTIENK